MKTMMKAALAATMLAGSFAAQATVVVTTVNIPVPNNIDGVYINVVTGATSGTEFAGYDINPYNNNAGLTFYTPENGGTVVAAAAGTLSVALDLAPGTVIGASSVFQNYQVTGDAFFRNTGSHNVGFKFLNEATNLINYGYYTITSTAGTGFPATVTGYAYENSGTSITVGGNVTPAVPEASTWAMMILGMGAVGGTMRRRSKSATRVSYAV